VSGVTKGLEEVRLNQIFISSLSPNSKLQTNFIGSLNLFVFYSISCTPNHGTFLFRFPTYFLQIHALAFAIINLNLGLVMNFITLMSMLDFKIRGYSFLICVEDDHMSISMGSDFYFVKVFNLCLRYLTANYFLDEHEETHTRCGCTCCTTG
jgi:hypothetical protein